MGNKIMSVATRPFRNFNLESRAHKVVSMDKPVAAPKFKTDALEYERIIKEHPEILEEGMKKHSQLDKHLKDVYVTSHDQMPLPPEAQTDQRPLPLNRSPVEGFEFGFKEPTKGKIPYGRTTLRNVLRFISEHQNKPDVATYQQIAEDYSLSEEKVKNILQYYRVFEVYIPEQRNVKARFAGPSIPRPQVKLVHRKPLLLGKEDKDKT